MALTAQMQLMQHTAGLQAMTGRDSPDRSTMLALAALAPGEHPKLPELPSPGDDHVQ